MIQVRKSEERGHFNHGWLNTYHTFSFGDYYDPKHEHFRTLRVINEDWVKPGMGFGTHPHRDMEIITYVLEGALEHKDSTGSHGVVRPGDVQRMSAGSGVLHSEFNASKSEQVHLLQIWLFPEKRGLDPGYEQKHFDDAAGWQLLVTPNPVNGELKIHQDAKLYRAKLKSGEEVTVPLAASRYGYLQVARGAVDLVAEGGATQLQQGDGASIAQESGLQLRAREDAEVLLFDLA